MIILTTRQAGDFISNMMIINNNKVATLFLLTMGYTAWHREITGGGLFFLTSLLISFPALLVCLACLGIVQTGAELPQWLLGATVLEAMTLGIGLRLRDLKSPRQPDLFPEERERALRDRRQ